ncbi:MAG: family transcriptional regulator, cyclic receptor protein [Actinomycetota bacterium]|jgi:CRP-like cAMP-binding protein
MSSFSEWDALAAYMEPRRFSPGETVLVPGEPDRSLYLLAEGTVEAIVTSKSGSKRTTVMEAGALFGEVAFFDGGARSATVRGVTHGELLRLGFPQFEAMAADRPELARALLLDLGVRVAGRLRAAERGQ